MQPIQTLRLAAFTLLLTAGFPLLPTPDSLLPAVAQTVRDRKAEGDRLLQQANHQFETRQPEAALQSSQQALQIYQAIKDRPGEGQSLANIGRAYRSLQDYAKAIEYSKQSLEIARRIRDRQLEGAVLERLGLIYFTTQDYANAVSYQEQSLATYRKIKDRIGERRVLGNLGNAYLFDGKDAKAIETLERSLALSRELKDQAAIMDAESDLGGAHFLIKNPRELQEQVRRQYQISQLETDPQSRRRDVKLDQATQKQSKKGNAPSNSERLPREPQTMAAQRKEEAGRLIFQGIEQLYLSQFEAADKSIQQAMLIYRELKDQREAYGVLQTFGMFYLVYRNFSRAIGYLEQSLPIAREFKDRDSERLALGSLGSAYAALGNYAKANKYLEQSLTIARELKDRQSEGYILGELGDVYYSLSNYTKAIKYHEQDLAIARKLEDRDPERDALGRLGNDHQALGNYDKAIKYHQQRLKISPEKSSSKAFALSGIGQTLQKQKQPELAIVLYKQSVNISEYIRQSSREMQKTPGLTEGLRGFGLKAEQDYTESVTPTYRNLADLLLQQNRVMEAMQVLDLLKVQELQDYLQDVKGNPLTAQGVPLLPQEREIVKAFDQNPAINKTISNPAVTALVAQLRHTAAAQNLTLPAYKDLQARIQKLGKNIALFYPLILDDRLELVLFIPNRPPIRKTVNVKRADFEREIGTFRTLLPDPDLAALSKIRQSAQQLYTWLMQPIDAELKAAKVQTIVYAPDGQMRYVPLAALHDGTQWLTERYQINYLTALALTPIDAPDKRSPTALTGALTQKRTITVAGTAYSFDPLKFTQAEVEQVAKTIPNTKSLIDQPFNRKNLVAQMPQAAIVHLATHAKFGGTPDESFIVLGDGDVVTLREIEAWKLPNVSLFVLSACETGVGGKLGNGLEILGFGYQMQRTGSRAAIASLWKVEDDGTSELMSEFYAALQKGNSKAEALRQAQIELINSGYRPLYWAPFILIGNGL